MTKAFTENSFASTYRDDFLDSDNYHRILFNSGRALQARELTQMQTIIQEEIGRMGRNMFVDGAPVNPGGPSINNSYEFVKLNTTVNQLPTDTSTLVGLELTGAATGFIARVLEVAPASGSDPDTLYITYVNTGTASSNTPKRFTNNENLTNSGAGITLTTQATNTTANPVVGQGTQISNGAGDFFVRGHFVFAKPQSIILSKYTKTPNAVVGFVTQEDIVTVDDDDALYDNQGATPNRSSPGADRYRIQLVLHNKADVASDENFIYYCDVQDGEIVDEVNENRGLKSTRSALAEKIKETEGDYIVDPFEIDFGTDSENGQLHINVSDGVAYVSGYRAELNGRKTFAVDKPRTTLTVANEVAGIDYGQYFICSTLKGLLNINALEQVNLRSAVTHGGSTIGTANIRYVEEDGANFRVYLFNIDMNSGSALKSVKSVGTSTSKYADIVLEGGRALIKDGQKQKMVFNLPNARPKAITDVDFEVQRAITATTNNSGVWAPSNLTTTGETYVNTSQWIGVRNDTGATVTLSSFSGAGTNSISCSTGVNNTSVTVYAKVNKAQPTIRPKTKVENATISNVSMKTVGSDTFVSLGKADVYRIHEIRKGTSTGRDISGDFTFDNGQRPGYYGPARLIRSGTSSYSGNVYCKFDYYDHGPGDVFAINSYATTTYREIPTVVVGPRQSVDLRDAIDFRSSTPDSDLDFTATGAVVNELPTAGDIFQGDVEYYLPRADLVYATVNPRTYRGQVKVLQGEPGFGRPIPRTPANSLPLFEIEHNAYGIGAGDLRNKILKYKSYSFKDINRIEERLDNLKEQVALTQLETSAETLLVLDSNGNNRLKSGILADNFKDKAFRDNLDPKCTSGISASTGTLMPASHNNGFDLFYDSDKSTGVKRYGDMVMLEHTHVTAISQLRVTGTENVNPFAVVSGRGTITLSPKEDRWMNTEYLPRNVINRTVERDLGVNQIPGEFNGNPLGFNNFRWQANPFIFDLGFEGEFGIFGQDVGLLATEPNPFNINPALQTAVNIPVTTNVIDEPLIDDEINLARLGETLGGNGTNFFDFNMFGWNGIQINNVQSAREEDAVFEGTVAQGRKRTTTFSKRVVVSDSVSTKFLSDRRVDVAFIPFMRSRLVRFKAAGLRPNTRYFPFFDNQDVATFCREESGSFEDNRFSANNGANAFTGDRYRKSTTHPSGSSNLVSDDAGEIHGSFFIPSTNKFRFRCGKREFKLLDIANNDNTAALSSARVQYFAQGTLEKRQKTFQTTRTIESRVNRWQEVTWVDPLAQSFTITQEEGIFLTKVQAFFKTKDSKEPVECQIRPMVNGMPSADIFLGSVHVKPADVTLPSAQTQAAVQAAPTTFEFPEPIYLSGGQDYCVVLLSDCTSYNAYVAETYAFELGSTEKRIDRQPSMGSLFKSQNGKTWDADQTKDMMFKVFRAEFNTDTSNTHAILENGALNLRPLINNPIRTTSGSSVVNVYCPNHGFRVSDTVTLSGLTTGNGIAANNLNGNHTITAVDGYMYRIDTGDNANADGRTGGNGGLTTHQLEYDIAIPVLETITPDTTAMSHYFKTTSGSSLIQATAGAHPAHNWTKDATYSGDFVIQDMNRFASPRLVGTTTNETSNLGSGEKSFTAKVDFETEKSHVSPMLDLATSMIQTMHHRIDKQSSGNTAGFNVPLRYSAETSPRGGSHMSRHITVPVTLGNGAVGLKILLAALRPSEADFEIYWRVATEGQDLFRKSWTLVNRQGSVAPDERNFREYKYLVGGDNGDMDEFTQYQIKIVMQSTNTSKVPQFKDLRIIAMAT